MQNTLGSGGGGKLPGSRAMRIESRKGILSRIFRRKKKKVTEVDYDEADLKP